MKIQENISVNEAKRIMGNDFFGPEEVIALFKPHLSKNMREKIKKINISPSRLEEAKNQYILYLGVSNLENGDLDANIDGFRNFFGTQKTLPVWFNAEEYEKACKTLGFKSVDTISDWPKLEEVLEKRIKLGWYLIEKKDIDESDESSEKFLQPKVIFLSYFELKAGSPSNYTYFAFLWNRRYEKIPYKYSWIITSSKITEHHTYFIRPRYGIEGREECGIDEFNVLVGHPMARTEPIGWQIRAARK